MKPALAGIALALLVSSAFALANGETAVTPFSEGTPGVRVPSPWQPLRLPGDNRETQFSLARDGDRVVLRMESHASASSLMHPLSVSTVETPRLTWRWKVDQVVRKGDLRTRTGDDYAARLYVMFDYPLDRLPFLQRSQLRLARAIYGDSVPVATLCYVWATREPAGTRAWSPYTDRVRMIVLRSGNGEAGAWQTETRDVAADFREAFDDEAPRIKAIAVAADTDNTRDHVISYFGDLRFLAN